MELLHFKFCLHFLPIFLFQETGAQAIDQTLVPGGSGREVVDAVVRRIRRSQIFPDDYDFLRRVSLLETNFGLGMNASNENYNGGIWGLSASDFDLTKNTRLSTFHSAILSTFNITWKDVSWNELKKPFYSGLGARLHLQFFSPSVPQTIPKQAVLWEKIYSKREAAGRNYNEFISRITQVENSGSNCNGMMDLTVVLDGSGSVGLKDFEVSKDFVATLFSNYDNTLVRKGFIVFGDEAYMIFPLDSNLSAEQIQRRVKSVGYPSEATNTNAGILMAVEMIRATRIRTSSPSILLVFTDGESNVGDGVSNIKLAQREKIITFSIGIGPRLNQSELLELAHNDSSHVMVVHDFQTLNTLNYRLNAEACLVSQKPDYGEVVTDKLKENETRYYQYPMPDTGLTVIKNVSKGSVQGYYSFTEQNPSQAIHDGLLKDRETYIPPRTDPVSKFTSGESSETDGGGNSGYGDQIYIGMHGDSGDENDYNVVCYEGDDDGSKFAAQMTTVVPEPVTTKVTPATTTESRVETEFPAPLVASTPEVSTSSFPYLAPVTQEDEGRSSSTTSSSPAPTLETVSVTKTWDTSPLTTTAPSVTTPIFTTSFATTPIPVVTSAPKATSRVPLVSATVKATEPPVVTRAVTPTVEQPSTTTSTTTSDLGNRQIASALFSRFGTMGNCKDNHVGFLPFPGRCDLYTLCACGVKVLLECAPGLYFDAKIGKCNFIQLVDCPTSPFSSIFIQPTQSAK